MSTLPQGLEFYYQMESTGGVVNQANPGVADLSEGGVAPGLVTGQISNALNFPSIASRLERPFATNWLDPVGLGEVRFSIAAWCRPTAFPASTADKQVIIIDGAGDPTEAFVRFELGITTSTQLPYFVSAQSNGTPVKVTFPTVLSIGQWVFLVGWIDGPAGLIGLSPFGGAPLTAVHDGSIVDPGGVAGYVGRLTNLVDGAFTGDIDDIAIYPNRVLSAAEITELYNSNLGVADITALTVSEIAPPAGTGTANTATAVTDTIPDNLDFWYRMDNTGTVVNAANPGTLDLLPTGQPALEAGYLQSALRIPNDTGNFLSRPISPRWIPTGGIGSTSFTVAVWVSLDALTGVTPYQTLIIEGVGSATTTYHFFLGYDPGLDRFVFITHQLDNTGFTVIANEFGAVASFAWHLVVGWVDANTGEVGISVNLYEDTLAGHDGSMQDLGGVAGYIGRLTNTVAGQARARIDDVSIWPRALTAGERVGLFNGGVGHLDLLSLAPAPPPWLNTDWAFRKELTVDPAQVVAPQVNFPVWVSIVDTDLRDQALANGDDIFFTDSTGTFQLDHEIESYDGGTGTLSAWVRMPSLSDTLDTDFYLYFGNPGAANQESPAGVWDSNFVGVWHFSEDPSGAPPQMLDSTANNNHGTSQGGMTSTDQIPGQLNGSLTFDETNDYIEMPDSPSLSPTTALTFSCWANQSVASSNDTFAAKWQYLTDGAWAVQTFGITAIFVFIATFPTDPGGTAAQTPFGVWPGTGWHHMAFVFDGTGAGNEDRLKIYVNGAESTPLTFTGTMPAALLDSASVLRIGEFENLGRLFGGGLDEVKISNTNRSGAWIETEYNNQSSPGTFITVGSVENAPAASGLSPYQLVARRRRIA